MIVVIKRMDIRWVELENKGSIQSGMRPCLIISNQVACVYSPTLVVVPITTATKRDLPTHMNINLKKPSTALFEQLLTVNKEQVHERISCLPEHQYKETEEKIKISLGLTPAYA